MITLFIKINNTVWHIFKCNSFNKNPSIEFFIAKFKEVGLPTMSLNELAEVPTCFSVLDIDGAILFLDSMESSKYPSARDVLFHPPCLFSQVISAPQSADKVADSADMSYVSLWTGQMKTFSNRLWNSSKGVFSPQAAQYILYFYIARKNENDVHLLAVTQRTSHLPPEQRPHRHQ